MTKRRATPLNYTVSIHHYMFVEGQTVANIREAEAKPLTKPTLQNVFDEMKAHAE